MRALKILLAVMCTAMLINFLRQGDDFPLPQVLPMCDGQTFSPLHAAAGIVLVFLLFWGLRRLARLPDHESSDDSD